MTTEIYTLKTLDLKEDFGLILELGQTPDECQIFTPTGEKLRLVSSFQLIYDADAQIPSVQLTVLNPKITVKSNKIEQVDIKPGQGVNDLFHVLLKEGADIAKHYSAEGKEIKLTKNEPDKPTAAD